jgi:hypothetical protein
MQCAAVVFGQIVIATRQEPVCFRYRQLFLAVMCGDVKGHELQSRMQGAEGMNGTKEV